MCRLLFVKAKTPFSTATYLKNFATISKNSKEFQGHGWGCAYLTESNQWFHYKNIKPVWEDPDLELFPETTQLIAHARSAFQDKGIIIDNNMPFYDDKYIFVFNGEVRGVKINAEGRIGAEKIFNFIKRFDKGDMLAALKKGVEIIKKRSTYVRATNILITDKEKLYLASVFNEKEDANYFTMEIKEEGETLVICSDKFQTNPEETGWKKIPNGTIKEYSEG